MPRVGRAPKGMKLETADTPELLALWNRALASPYGIKIASQKGWNLCNRLYKARRECGHFNYSGLRVTHDDKYVWIVPYKERKLEPA